MRDGVWHRGVCLPQPQHPCQAGCTLSADLLKHNPLPGRAHNPLPGRAHSCLPYRHAARPNPNLQFPSADPCPPRPPGLRSFPPAPQPAPPSPATWRRMTRTTGATTWTGSPTCSTQLPCALHAPTAAASTAWATTRAPPPPALPSPARACTPSEWVLQGGRCAVDSVRGSREHWYAGLVRWVGALYGCAVRHAASQRGVVTCRRYTRSAA